MDRASIHAHRASAATAVAFMACVMPQAASAQGAAVGQAADITTLCRFDQGPRAGTSIPMAGELGARCDDGAGSSGVIMRRPIVQPGAVYVPPPPPPPPPPPTLPTPAPEQPPAATLPTPLPTGTLEPILSAQNKPAIGTRLFVPFDPRLPAAYGAVGVIAFRGAASNDIERSRRILICQAYVSELLDSEVVQERSPDMPQMVTLWPRDDITQPLSFRKTGVADVSAECGLAVDHYDTFAGEYWLDQLSDSRTASRRGPFLIAWSPPDSQGDPNAPALFVDLSDFSQEETILEAFRLWKERIEADPSLWSNGWDRTLLRLKLQATVDKYGGLVVAAFKMVPFVGDE